MATRPSSVVSKRLLAMEKTLTGKDMKDRLVSLTPYLRGAAKGAGAGDLGGDLKFTGGKGRGSGWHGPDALDIVVRAHRNGQGITVGRSRGSAGPWRVADQGRNQGETGLFLGPAINARTGMSTLTKSGKVRKERARRVKRRNGTTEGKGTWGKAASAMESIAAPKFRKATVKAVADAFTKG